MNSATDGELLGQLPLEITFLPIAISMFVPQETHKAKTLSSQSRFNKYILRLLRPLRLCVEVLSLREKLADVGGVAEDDDGEGEEGEEGAEAAADSQK